MVFELKVGRGSMKILNNHRQEFLGLTIYSFHSHDPLKVCYLLSRNMETSKTEPWSRSFIHP